MQRILSVDVGYSSVKITFSDGSNGFFKSTVDPFFSKGLLDEKEDFFTIDGKVLRVGDEGSTRGNVGDDFHGGPRWYVLMCRAFLELAIKGEHYTRGVKPVDDVIEINLDVVGIGVPFLDYTKEKVVALQGITDFSFEFAGQKFKINCGNITVFYQGMATLANHKTLKPLLGIVDVGYYTCDLVLIRNGRVDNDFSSTFKKGVSTLHTKLNNALIKELRCSTRSSDALRKVLDDREMFWNGEMRDVGHIVDSVVDSFAGEVDLSVRELWDQWINEIHEINFTGGGSFYLDALVSGREVCVRPDEPVFGNSDGYMKVLLKRASKKAA